MEESSHLVMVRSLVLGEKGLQRKKVGRESDCTYVSSPPHDYTVVKQQALRAQEACAQDGDKDGIPMKTKRTLSMVVGAILITGVGAVGQEMKTAKTTPEGSEENIQILQGRWDLTLKSPDREYPSWLELQKEDGQWKAQMVGRWGNARPLPSVTVTDNHLRFVSPKEEEEAQTDMVFEGTIAGNKLTGQVNGPDGKTWTWTGRKAPTLIRSLMPKWGKPISLFNGKDLTGWTMSDPKATTVWKVENGALISPGNGPELINDKKFEDFKLHVEFKCGEMSNSGIYLRGRYEVQIETDSIEEPPSHHTGGIYGFLEPDPEQPRKPGEWQTFDIALIGRRVTVVQNGQTIINNKEIPGITGGALDSNEELPGPIYLQGSEKGHVAFRSIILTPAEK
jgi:3-keto-disaccharide hydrolase